MNEKTAKLLRKYAKAMDANLNDLKRQWNDMDQFERRDFRIRMLTAIETGVTAEEAEQQIEVEDAEEAIESEEPAEA